MNRLTWTAAGLAFAALVNLTAGPAGAQGGKVPPVKEIMTKLNKKGGIFPTLAAELKANPLKWDEIQKQTGDYTQMADMLGKNEPPTGSKPSWEKLTKEFAKNAKDMDAAAQKKDKSGVQAAHRKIQNSCSACHDTHRG